MSELRKYGVLLTTAKALKLVLYKQDGLTFATSATVTFATGDVKISKNGGAYANTTNLPVVIGNSWYLILTAAELTAASIKILVSDLTVTQVWLDTELTVETYGNASAMHAFDLDTASVAQTADHTSAIADVPTVSEFNARTLASADYFDPANDDVATVTTVGTTTTLTNLPAITPNWLTAAGISAGALDDKGNWNIGKTGYSLAATGLDLITATSTAFVAIAKAVWDRVLTGALHNIAASAGRRLRGLQDFQTYSSYIWIDTIDGVAGIIAGENGTENNPVLTWADALTLEALTETPSKRFHAANDSSLTLTASIASYSMLGTGWTLVLNGQVMDDAYITGPKVSGTGINSTGHTHLDFAEFDTCTLGNIHCHNAHINATINMANTGDYFFGESHSGVVGVGQPIFNFGAVGAQNLALRDWDGSVEIQNMAAGDNCSIDGTGRKVVINANCTGGTLVIAGVFDLEDNSGGAVTIEDNARVDYDQIRHSVWRDTLTTYVDGEAGKRVKGLSAVSTQEGTVNDVGATTTTFTTTLTGLAVNALKDGLLEVEVAPDEWEGKPILSSDATGGVVLSEPLTSAPANGIAVVFSSTHIHPISQIQAGLALESKQDAQDLIITETRLVELDAANIPNDLSIIKNYVDELESRLTSLRAGYLDNLSGGNVALQSTLTSLNNLAGSDILTQVNAALDTAISELGIAVPSATPTLRTGLMLMYMMARNEVNVDTSGVDAMKVHNDAGVQITSKTITDDGTDYSEGKMS